MLRLNQGEYLGEVRSTVLAEGLRIGITEYHGVHQFGQMHCHENPHLSFVLKGNMAVKRKHFSVSDSVLEPYSYMRAGEIHQNAVHGDWCKNMNLELEPEFFSKYGLNENDFSFKLMGNRPGAALLMVRLYKELLVPDMNLSDSVHVLLLEAAQSWKEAGRGFPGWVEVVRDLLNDCWNEEITLQEVAAAAGVHPVTVSKYFSRYFGSGFGEYRRKLKTERAILMMSQANASLTEVSYACGFFDQSHFIRAFKDFTSLLPGEFKKA